MSERYTRLYSLPKSLYTTGAPVVIEAGALLLDNNKNRVIAQLKFRNIDDRNIHAVKIRLTTEDAFGAVLDGDVEYQYLDLDESRNTSFGQNVPVIIPDVNARSYTVTVDEVAFTDGSSWQGSSEVWEPLDAQQELDEVLDDDELVKQYQIKYGSSAAKWPSEQKDLWLCTCGSINKIGEQKCCSCDTSIDSLRSFDRSELEKEKDARLEQERIEEEKRQEALAEQQRIEAQLAAEKAAAKAEKMKKAKKIAIPVTAAVIAVALILTLFVIPTIKKSNEYKEAVNYYSSGDYEQARDIFKELGSFKDSEDKLKECEDAIAEAENVELYNEIQGYLKDRSYPADMGETLQKLGDYKDSKAILDEYNAYLEAAKAMDTTQSPYMGVECFTPAVELMKTAKYVKFPEGTERFLEIFVPFLGKWTYSSGDDQLLSYTAKDASRHKSMKDIEIKYTMKANTNEGTIQVFNGESKLYISLPTFNVDKVTFEETSYVPGDFIYSMKDANTLRVDFKGKSGMSDSSVEYKRAD